MLTRRLMKNFHSEEKGFTLIELLIVVAILGSLSAVVTPNFTSLIGTGVNEAKAVELRTVQTAMIAVMADNHVSTVAAQASAVGDLTGLPTGTGVSTDFDDFLIDTDTAYTYTWTTAGVVSQP